MGSFQRIRSVLLLSACLLMAVSIASAAPWVESLESAKAQAASQRRPILMYFTGSDWCPYCIQFKRAVLDTAEFQQFADSSLILFMADFPRARPVAALQLQANRQLAARYGVTGYPTVFLAYPDGQVIGNLGTYGNPKDFISAIHRFYPPGSKLTETASGAAAGTGSPPRPGPAKRPVQELPLFAGAETHPPTIYTNLVLKSISGTGTRRFALVNSETMSAGDTVRLTMGGSKLSVRCVEVREKSVLVQVQGEKSVRELKLSPPVARLN